MSTAMSSGTSRATTPKRSLRGQRDKSAQLRVVPPGSRLLRVGALTFCVFAVAVLFGMVAFNALIVRTQSTLDELDVRLGEVREVNQRLLFEIAELESPERVRAVALDQLGMIEPEAVTYLEPVPRHRLESVPVEEATGQGAAESR